MLLRLVRAMNAAGTAPSQESPADVQVAKPLLLSRSTGRPVHSASVKASALLSDVASAREPSARCARTTARVGDPPGSCCTVYVTMRAGPAPPRSVVRAVAASTSAETSTPRNARWGGRHDHNDTPCFVSMALTAVTTPRASGSLRSSDTILAIDCST